MKIKKRIFSFLMCILLLSFAVLMIIKPEICKKSVASAILLCGQVIIPSLFPFGVCVLFLMKSGICENLEFLSPITLKISGLSAYPFFIFLFSMLGGYPIGAKLLNEAVESEILTQKQAEKMLCFCVNAGPAFIVSAVGNAVLKNTNIGYILLISHILSSLSICRFSGKITAWPQKTNTYLSASDNFVSSASSSANAVTGICFYVILFSAVTGYIDYFSKEFPILKSFLYITEITGAVTKTRNVYIISFLLAFSGICIWCQIFSVAKAIKINVFKFAFFRIFHGFLSSLITFLILKIYPLETETFSNISSFPTKVFVSGKALGISLFILGIVFIISLSNRQNSQKMLEELL
ncbi:MAG: hypothetical protein J6B22_01710 [Clostridia bacterium]|nr:hypothetical protein [Clostridia bacterium]